MVNEKRLKTFRAKLLKKVTLLICTIAYFGGILLLSSFLSFTEVGETTVYSEKKEAPFPIEQQEGISSNPNLNTLKISQLKDSIITFAHTLQGRPYQYGSNGPESFDCSGFVSYVFNHFNLDLKRTSRSQSTQGEEVSLNSIQKGDLLFFTGTNNKIRKVGHVGIVISEANENLSFIHASSNGGVKISELAGRYQTRFLKARRVLTPERIFRLNN